MSAPRRAFALVTLLGAIAHADGDKLVVVPSDDDPAVGAPTSTLLDPVALEERPRVWPNHLLDYLPGLVALGQGWNAPQYLTRGFDAGPGTTLGVSVDDVPINESSHVYANGYADLGFVIPETVGSMALHEGSYAPRFGSFAAAGQLALRTIDSVRAPTVRLTTALDALDKSFNRIFQKPRYRLVGMFSPDVEKGSALLATEVALDDGPFVHRQRLRRAVMLGKWKRALADGTIGATVQVYSGRWFDSGLLSSTAIAQGRLTPFSSADPTQGGIVMRTSAQITYEVRDRHGATWSLSSFVVDANQRLYTNPTLFLRDRLRGDELELVDERVYYGVDGYYRRRHRLGPLRGNLRIGMQARADHTSGTTWHNGRRLRLVDCFGAMNPCTDVELQTRSIGLYVEEHLAITKWMRVFGGARFQQDVWNVDDLDPETRLGATTRGGSGARARINPKLGVMTKVEALELWLLGSAGTLDTDARAAVDFSGYGAFVRTYTGDVGFRVRPTRRSYAAFSAWASSVDAHLEWVPAFATSVSVGATTRLGFEMRFSAPVTRWLTYDASLSIARGDVAATPTTRSDVVIYAPRSMGQTGLVARWKALFGAVRLRVLGPRHTADHRTVAAGHELVDVVGGYRWRMLDFGLTVENVLDSDWRELQVASSVRTSRRVDATRDLLVTPGIPRTIWLTLGYSL
jgi:hypothetical protein